MIYTLIRAILFQVDPEKAHTVALEGLALLKRLGCLRSVSTEKKPPLSLMNLSFKNRVGLAAGLDKNGDYINALGALGFGHLEIGTVTPKPQIGNSRPRLFRLLEDDAIINRMGFNSKGADYVLKQLETRQYDGVLGINIGKNKDTPIDNALDDYLVGFKTFAEKADYITINISSPNTEKLRELQQADHLSTLLSELKKAQGDYKTKTGKYVPLLVKIAPDLTSSELNMMASIFVECMIDGIIATNTTVARATTLQSPEASEIGGLSGRPLFLSSTNILCELANVLQNRIPLIGVGGIMDKSDAEEKVKAGASLVQIYSGLIYKGPTLIKECVQKLLSY